MTGRPGIPQQSRENARRLRQTLTEVERILWERLRAHRFHGAGFRRQVPMGRYVVDFICHAHRLVIELDGGQHGEDGQRRRDERRTRFIEEEGYRVLRFWNGEVVENLDGVLYRIGQAIGVDRGGWSWEQTVDNGPGDRRPRGTVGGAPPSPTLPHKGGGSRSAQAARREGSAEEVTGAPALQDRGATLRRRQPD